MSENAATTPLELTVSPDFSPEHIAGWYVFNTWLQRRLGERIHLELYEDFAAQRQAIAADKVDLIYANPYDAAMLVREKGFVAIAAPRDCPDEVVIAVPADSPAQSAHRGSAARPAPGGDPRPGCQPDRHDPAGVGRPEPRQRVHRLGATYVVLARTPARARPTAAS